MNTATIEMTEAQEVIEFKNIGGDIAEHMSYLAYRWQDECKYEDFADYADSLRKQFESTSFELLKLTKGFKATIEGINFIWTMKVNKKSITSAYKRKVNG